MRIRTLLAALTLVGIGVIAGYLIFGNNTKANPNATNPTAQSNTSTSTDVCMDYSGDQMSTLDADLIHFMTKSYRDNQLTYIQTKQGTIAPTDAYSIWFDLPTLKKFLYHIEKISQKFDSSITDTQLGVRFYYATYPKTEEYEKYNFTDLIGRKGNSLFPSYNGLHTLVMVPTLEKNNLKFDFNPLDESTFVKGFSEDTKYAYNSKYNIPNNQTAALSGSTQRDMGSKNHGILYPPTSTVGLGF